MRVAIAGSRKLNDKTVVEGAIEGSGFEITTIVSGGARGVDQIAEAWARMRGIPVELVKPDWGRFKKGAGLLANDQILAKAEALVAIWDGKSKGTQDLLLRAKEKGIPVNLVRVDASS